MGPYLSTPISTKNHTPENKDFEEFQYLRAVATDMQGWRNNMEDAHIVHTNIGGKGVSVFGVFDGHGGQEVAKFVEKYFVKELEKLSEFKDNKFDEALIKTFYRMDELMETKEGKDELEKIKAGPSGDQSGAMSYAGCTANVALLYKNELYVANAGDSRSVLAENGKAIGMSEDHKPESTIEKDRIINAGGYISEGRVNGNLNLSRALGDLEYKQQTDRSPSEQLIVATPDVKKVVLNQNHQFLVMGCDGIWECKDNQEVVTFVQERLEKNQKLKDINEQLLTEILAPDTAQGTGCDNMSLILVQFSQSPANFS